MTSPSVTNIVKTILSPITKMSRSISSILSRTFSMDNMDLQEGNDDTIYATMTSHIITSTPSLLAMIPIHNL